ncbi:uncharacterized protein LOC115225519 [Octopus sinensis]|uniref:Uncharacterized protein LOC115225519 n=1 Tax=Octopus sinensis TaxID=2607531 RepID=A0A6P7TSL1_9MOLL|nr:uncharacterized protein LOC115225519 [Octopus sinensis]
MIIITTRSHKENKEQNILWDFIIQCESLIEVRRPDIVVVDEGKKEIRIIAPAIPGDSRISDKEREKIKKYRLPKDEVARMWTMRKLSVIPVVLGVFGELTTKFEKYITVIGIDMRAEQAQKTVLLWSSMILRLVVGC